MEKLGKSLKDFYLNIEDSLKLPDILKIGIALIERVRKLHQAGFIHGDIKPDNIVLGDFNGPMNLLLNGRDSDKDGGDRVRCQQKLIGMISDRMQHVHLIDFGLTEMYMNVETK